MIEVDALKWRPWLNLAGLKNRQKLTRLSFKHPRTVDELSGLRSVCDLNGGTGPFRRWLRRAGRRIPFVEAVCGSSACTFARAATAYEVYAAPSDYPVKPFPPGGADGR